MEQMNIPEDQRIVIDLSAPGMPKSAGELLPVVFQEEDSYCCLLGADPTVGIFGCGDTPEAAVKDWAADLKRRLDSPSLEDDETALYARDVLKANPNDVW